jgi:hypothetical protein
MNMRSAGVLYGIVAALAGVVFVIGLVLLKIQALARRRKNEPLVNPKRFQTLFGKEFSAGGGRRFARSATAEMLSFRAMRPGNCGNLGSVGNVESVTCRAHYPGDGTNPLSPLLL